jgi:subtilisin family serine protease
VRVAAGYPKTSTDVPPPSGPVPFELDHGTQCAAMAASVAPGALIRSIAVDDGAGGYPFDDVLAALDLLVDRVCTQGAQGLDVVSISLADQANVASETCGIDATQASCFARHVENLGAFGIVVAVSAGNSGLDEAVEFPACVANALTVGATDGQFARRAGYSNWGVLVDVAAPGSDVLLPGWTYSLPSGTSIATPFAAGLVARLRAKHPASEAADVVDALVRNGEPYFASAQLPQVLVPEVRVDKADAWLGQQGTPGGG